jgi:hypothetical protein
MKVIKRTGAVLDSSLDSKTNQSTTSTTIIEIQTQIFYSVNLLIFSSKKSDMRLYFQCASNAIPAKIFREQGRERFDFQRYLLNKNEIHTAEDFREHKRDSTCIVASSIRYIFEFSISLFEIT